MMLPCAISATVQGYPQLKRAQVRPLQQTHHFPSPILSMFRSTLTCRLLVAIASTIAVNAQSYGENAFGRDRNASFPHTYPGMPEGEFSPKWQNCTLFPCCALISSLHTSLCVDFQVTEPLPNVTFDLGRNWAGNIPVGRGSANNTLFFWAFEKEEGSLTAAAGERNDEPWGIFINS